MMNAHPGPEPLTFYAHMRWSIWCGSASPKSTPRGARQSSERRESKRGSGSSAYQSTAVAAYPTELPFFEHSHGICDQREKKGFWIFEKKKISGVTLTNDEMKIRLPHHCCTHFPPRPQTHTPPRLQLSETLANVGKAPYRQQTQQGFVGEGLVTGEACGTHGSSA